MVDPCDGLLLTCNEEVATSGGGGSNTVLGLTHVPLLHRVRASVTARAERDARAGATTPLALKRVAMGSLKLAVPQLVDNDDAEARRAFADELHKNCTALDDVMSAWRRHWRGSALRFGGVAAPARRSECITASLLETFTGALFSPHAAAATPTAPIAATAVPDVGDGGSVHVFVPYEQQVCAIDLHSYYECVARMLASAGGADGDGEGRVLECASLNTNLLHGGAVRHVLEAATTRSTTDAAIDRRLCAPFASHNLQCVAFYTCTGAQPRWLGCADVYAVERADAAGVYALPPDVGAGGGEGCAQLARQIRTAVAPRGTAGAATTRCAQANFFVQRTPLYAVLRAYGHRLRAATAQPPPAPSPPTPILGPAATTTTTTTTTRTAKATDSQPVPVSAPPVAKPVPVVRLSRSAVLSRQVLNQSAQWARSSAVCAPTSSNHASAPAAATGSSMHATNSRSLGGTATVAAAAVQEVIEKGIEWACPSDEQMQLVRSCVHHVARDHELVDKLGLRRDTRVEHCAAYYTGGTDDYVAAARKCASAEHREAFRERMRAYTGILELYKHRRAQRWLLRKAFGRERWRHAADPVLRDAFAEHGDDDNGDGDDDDLSYVPLDTRAWDAYKLALLATLHDTHLGHLLRTNAGRETEAATYALAALLAAADRDFEETFVFCEYKLASLRYKHMYAHSEASLDEMLRLRGERVETMPFAYACTDGGGGGGGGGTGSDEIFRVQHIEAARQRCFERAFGPGDVDGAIADCAYYFSRDAPPQRRRRARRGASVVPTPTSLSVLLRGAGDSDDIDFLDFFDGGDPRTTTPHALCAAVERELGRFATAYRREYATKYYVLPTRGCGAAESALRKSMAMFGAGAAFVQASSRRHFESTIAVPSGGSDSRRRRIDAPAADGPAFVWHAPPAVPVVQGRMLLHHRQVGRYMAQRVAAHCRERVRALRAQPDLGVHAAPVWAVGRVAALFAAAGAAADGDDVAERVADQVHNYVRYFYRMHPSEHSANVRVHEASAVARIVEAAHEAEARFERAVGSALCHDTLWPHYEAFVLAHGASDYAVKRVAARHGDAPRMAVARKTLADRMGGTRSGIVDVLAGDAVVDEDAEDGDSDDVAAMAKVLDARETPGVDVERDERTGHKLRYSDAYVDAQLWRETLVRPCGAGDIVALARTGGFFAPCVSRIVLACVDDGVHPGNRARYVLSSFLYSLRYSDEQVLEVFVRLYRADARHAHVTLETFDGATGGMAKSICAQRRSFEKSGTPACQTIIGGGGDKHVANYMCPFADPALELRAPPREGHAPNVNRLRLSSKHTVDIEDVVREYADIAGVKDGARIDAMSKRNVRYVEAAAFGGGDRTTVNTHSRSDVQYGRVLGQKLCRAMCRRDGGGCSAGGASSSSSSSSSSSVKSSETSSGDSSDERAATQRRHRRHITPAYARRSYLFGSTDVPNDANGGGGRGAGHAVGGSAERMAAVGERYVPGMRRPLHYTEYVMRQHIDAATKMTPAQIGALADTL